MNDPNMHVRYHSRTSRANGHVKSTISPAPPRYSNAEAVIDAILAHDSDMPPVARLDTNDAWNRQYRELAQPAT